MNEYPPQQATLLTLSLRQTSSSSQHLPHQELSGLTKEKRKTTMKPEKCNEGPIKSAEQDTETKNEDNEILLLDMSVLPKARPTTRDGPPTLPTKAFFKRKVRFASPDRKSFINTNRDGISGPARKRTVFFDCPPERESRERNTRAPLRRNGSSRFRTATKGKRLMAEDSHKDDCDTNAHKRRRLNRLWSAKVQSMKTESESSMSPMINSHTVQKQAEVEPNFVGDAYVYKLTKPANKEQLEGEYTVVYTRPVGNPFDPVKDSRCVVFPPSDTRIIKVRTQSRNADELRELLKEGNYATGEFIIRGTPIRFQFFLDPVKGYHPDKDLRKILPGPVRQREYQKEHPNAHKTTFRVRQRVNNDDKFDFDWSEHSEYAKYPELVKILYKNLTLVGHTITFGFKTFDNEYEIKDHYGFHFIEMELACVHPVTGAPDRQLVVAVKLPAKESNANVSSHLLLKQELTSNHDLRILNGDSTMAWYHQFSADEIYGQPARGRPSSEGYADLMTSQLRFDASVLESHLLLQKQPIEELEKILNLLKGSDHEDDSDDRRTEAIAYATNRLVVFKQSRGL